MNEEILRIQRMVAEGKVSAEESVELLESIGLAHEAKQASSATEKGIRRKLAQGSLWTLIGGIALSLLILAIASMGRDSKQGVELAATALVISLIVACAAGRMALAKRCFGEPQLVGWPRFQAAIGVVAMILLSLLAAPSLIYDINCDDNGLVYLNRVWPEAFGPRHHNADLAEFAFVMLWAGTALVLAALAKRFMPGAIQLVAGTLFDKTRPSRMVIPGVAALVLFAGTFTAFIMKVGS